MHLMHKLQVMEQFLLKCFLMEGIDAISTCKESSIYMWKCEGCSA